MQNSLHSELDIIVGDLPITPRTSPSYAAPVISFLDALSTAIRKSSTLDAFPDLKTFGFWCRRANLMNLKDSLQSRHETVGRGIALHITPSNVAMNFAYSLAFGLLAGNMNIVRLPSRNFGQVAALVGIIEETMSKAEHADLKPFICLVKYPRSDTISQALSLLANVRLLWGGDDTIRQFKQYPTQPRCLDLAFSDRYSFSLIDPEAVGEASPDELLTLASRFYNDCYTMDQLGCSSPQAVIWSQGGHEAAKELFWNALSEIVTQTYPHDISIAADKFLAITEMAAADNINFNLVQTDIRVSRLQITEPSPLMHAMRCKFGMFVECSLASIDEVHKIISDKVQTITHFGVSRNDILSALQKHHAFGVDRIVPIGRAFDMGPVWDGYDIIAMQSRFIGD